MRSEYYPAAKRRPGISPLAAGHAVSRSQAIDFESKLVFSYRLSSSEVPFHLNAIAECLLEFPAPCPFTISPIAQKLAAKEAMCKYYCRSTCHSSRGDCGVFAQ